MTIEELVDSHGVTSLILIMSFGIDPGITSRTSILSLQIVSCLGMPKTGYIPQIRPSGAFC